MKPASFEYVRPATLPEAIAALDHDDAKIIAGGQSLVPMMNFRLVQPERLVDINRIPDLAEITETETEIRVGSLVRHAAAARDERLQRHFPVIAEAMARVAHIAIRNRGSIGGSLVHADPSAEWPLLVTLLDGRIEILGPDGSRLVAAADFFLAPLVTEIDETELITAVSFLKPGPATGMAFEEVAQRAGDFGIATAGAFVRVENGLFSDVRLTLGGVADTAVRAAALEAALCGKIATGESIATAVDLATDGLQPNSDLHASAEYRLTLVPVLAGRALRRALEQARTGARQ